MSRVVASSTPQAVSSITQHVPVAMVRYCCKSARLNELFSATLLQLNHRAQTSGTNESKAALSVFAPGDLSLVSGVPRKLYAFLRGLSPDDATVKDPYASASELMEAYWRIGVDFLADVSASNASTTDLVQVHHHHNEDESVSPLPAVCKVNEKVDQAVQRFLEAARDYKGNIQRMIPFMYARLKANQNQYSWDLVQNIRIWRVMLVTSSAKIDAGACMCAQLLDEVLVQIAECAVSQLVLHKAVLNQYAGI